MKVILVSLLILLSCSINVRDPNTSSDSPSQPNIQVTDKEISTDDFKIISVVPDNNCFIKFLMMAPDSSLYVTYYYLRASNKLYKVVSPIDVRF